ncbi:unnamed protein product [Rotaria magnacalcarata]|uniref:Transposase n=1 Tax=Rotaria magnacalcarata TaxID=392030 RepID=A0A816W434_9BILA|nr:unnamed protein product [Rotaria magnacalcarata]CAF3896806.1 unnamed protein product [Rotaria magnacalcarata]
MKSKDLQQVVFRKYEDGDGPTKIFRDLNGSLGLATIKRWCKMIRDTSSIQLSKPPGGPRFARTNEKIFDLDGMFTSQNQCIWAVSRDEADEKEVTPLVIFDPGTVDHVEYIQKVLPVALKYGNKTFGKHWTFQQDGAKPHIHHLTQTWCQDNFPSFIAKDHWLPNSPDLNPLDYCIWDEFAQCVNWKKVTSKATLIDELKCAVKKIRQDVVLQSCSSCTARLNRVLKNGGCYLKKLIYVIL